MSRSRERDENGQVSGSRPPHVAFLSSLSEGVRGLRRELYEKSRGHLWVAERTCPALKLEPPLRRIDACIGRSANLKSLSASSPDVARASAEVAHRLR